MLYWAGICFVIGRRQLNKMMNVLNQILTKQLLRYVASFWRSLCYLVIVGRPLLCYTNFLCCFYVRNHLLLSCIIVVKFLHARVGQTRVDLVLLKYLSAVRFICV